MTQLIAPGSTATTFATGEFTVSAGAPKSILLKPNAVDAPVPTGVIFELAHKQSSGNYTTLAQLHGGNFLQFGTINAAGTYALRRLASSYSAGADIEG